MRQPWTLVVVIGASACGRVGFDPTWSGGGDGASAGVSDGVSISAYANAVLGDGPIAYFRLNETTGPVTRSSVGSAVGTFEGSFTFGAGGAVGDGDPCVVFDGQTSRIELGDLFRFAGNAPYSMEVWINPVELATTRFVLDRRTSSGPIEGYTMYVGDTFLLFARQTNNTEFGYVSGMEPALNAWTYAVVTYDGAKQTLYLDGVYVQENTGTAASPIGEGPGHFVIGDKSPGQFFKFSGRIDELAIYDRELTASQVATHFQAAGR